MKYFNKLNINQKLWLYLLLPCFALLYFASSLFFEQHKSLQTDLKVYQSFEASKVYAELLHSLQQERGLSAGLLSSDFREFYKNR